MSLLFIWNLIACSADDSNWDYLYSDQYILEESHANLIRQIDFFGPDEEGLTWGFDLDGVVSAEGEEDSCGHGDFEDQEGRV